jgi:cell wall-associated NlpC family hydrolase
MQRISLAVLSAAAACALAFAGAAAAAGPVFVVVSDDSSAAASAPATASFTPNDAASQVDAVGLAGQIDDFLRSQGSPMAGSGASFVAAGNETGIDPRYLVSISGAESSFGKALFRPFNPFGWGYVTFSSWDQAIRTVAYGLQKGYLSEGRTDVYSIAAKYSPVGADNDPNHTNAQEPVNVAKYLVELGGNPNDIRAQSSSPLSTAQGLGGFATVWGSSPGAQAASIALRYVGVPYVWGGASPTGFDCSGLAMFAYSQVGITLPHWTGYQWKVGRVVQPNELLPGDLLFFDMEGGNPGHEGMYVGNGLMVQAPHTGDIVRVVQLASGTWAQRFVRAVRPY